MVKRDLLEPGPRPLVHICPERCGIWFELSWRPPTPRSTYHVPRGTTTSHDTHYKVTKTRAQDVQISWPAAEYASTHLRRTVSSPNLKSHQAQIKRVLTPSGFPRSWHGK